jgi:uncharacterized membrane-anchored protein
MKNIGIIFSLIALFASQSAISNEQPAETTEQPAAASEQNLISEQEQAISAAQKIWDAMEPQQGEVTLPNGVATLNIPENFYYLNPKDTKTVLEDVWGNVPGSAANSLGMLFPSEYTPFDGGSWGVIIEYSEDGYVSDEDADEIDYSDLLDDMKSDTAAASAQRVEQGYEPIELIGWASEPFYDKTTHKMHWAQEIRFGDNATNTLNYDIRVLGRKGVLVLSFVASMDQMEMVKSNIDSVLAMSEFNSGYRYEEFDPSIDKVAAYGLGALVAGKVIAKTGLLAAALIFLKKFGVLILIGLGALFVKLFKRQRQTA